MIMNPATTAVMFLLIGISIAHLARIIFKVDIVVYGFPLPSWVSVLGCIIPALLAWLLWRENRK